VVSYLQTGNAADLRLIALSGETMTVGRLARNDITLADDSVSRLHALLENRSGTWCIRDLSSRNGTFVNGERILTERVLRDSDDLRIGASRLVFRDDVVTPYEETHAAEPPPELTRRERDVLLALFRGANPDEPFLEPASTRQIALALVVSEAAVKQHLLNLYRKFDIAPNVPGRRLRLANEAMRRGALRVSELRLGA
jgi:predicted component of type VI protein secretion system